MRALAFFIAAFTVLVWGVTFVSTKALLADFSPFEILLLRFAIAYAALWALAPRRLKPKAPRDELWFALAGLSGATVYQMLENMAIHYTNASNVSILVSICPMFTAVTCQVFLGERAVTRRFALGFAIAIFGVALVSLDGVASFHFRPAGDFLALAAGVSWGFYGLFVSLLNRRGHPPLESTRRIFFYALLFMLPVAAAGVLFAPPTGADISVNLSRAANAARLSSRGNWGNLLFLGLFASAGCFVAWNRACEILGTVRVNVGIYLIPAVTVAFAYLFLGERLSPPGALGAVCTVVGVVLSGRRRRAGGALPNGPADGARRE